MKERGRSHVLGRKNIQKKGEVKNFGHEGGATQVTPLMGNPDPP